MYVIKYWSMIILSCRLLSLKKTMINMNIFQNFAPLCLRVMNIKNVWAPGTNPTSCPNTKWTQAALCSAKSCSATGFSFWWCPCFFGRLTWAWDKPESRSLRQAMFCNNRRGIYARLFLHSFSFWQFDDHFFPLRLCKGIEDATLCFAVNGERRILSVH